MHNYLDHKFSLFEISSKKEAAMVNRWLADQGIEHLNLFVLKLFHFKSKTIRIWLMMIDGVTVSKVDTKIW